MLPSVFVAPPKLVDVTVSARNGSEPEHRPFVAVARDHIQVAYEAE